MTEEYVFEVRVAFLDAEYPRTYREALATQVKDGFYIVKYLQDGERYHDMYPISTLRYIIEPGDD